MIILRFSSIIRERDQIDNFHSHILVRDIRAVPMSYFLRKLIFYRPPATLRSATSGSPVTPTFNASLSDSTLSLPRA